jgi:hypothetical protein
MSRVSSIIVLAGALAGVGMMACNALQTTQVTLDIRGSSLAVFTGSYETTTNGITPISGSPPKSYTFEARKQYDIVEVQLAYAGSGELVAKLVSDGVTRDSGSINTVGTLALHWTPK